MMSTTCAGSKVFHSRSVAVLALSGWMSAFAGYACLVCSPECAREYLNFAGKQTETLAMTVIVSGILGVGTAGMMVQHLAKTDTWGRAVIVPIGFIVSAPFISTALHANSKTVFLILFALGTFFLMWFHAPVTLLMQDFIPSANASRVLYLAANLLSIFLAPTVIGKISHYVGLRTALHGALAAQIFGALLFLIVIQAKRTQVQPEKSALLPQSEVTCSTAYTPNGVQGFSPLMPPYPVESGPAA